MSSLIAQSVARTQQASTFNATHILVAMRSIMTATTTGESTPYKSEKPRRFKTNAKDGGHRKAYQPGGTNKQEHTKPRSFYIRPVTPPPTASITELANRAFIVQRTPSAQLPVYRSGRDTKIFTKIKKVEGDVKLFVEQITEGLSLDKDKIKINPTTGHIAIKVSVICPNEDSGTNC